MAEILEKLNSIVLSFADIVGKVEFNCSNVGGNSWKRLNSIVPILAGIIGKVEFNRSNSGGNNWKG